MEREGEGGEREMGWGDEKREKRKLVSTTMLRSESQCWVIPSARSRTWM